MDSKILKLSRRLKTPKAVQDFLRALPYNIEPKGETARSAEASLKLGTAHCFEAAFIAVAILEQHGYPPLVLSLESQDGLDHVIYVFKKSGRWGSVARSRDEGLHGRSPRYRSARDLAMSYYDPYIDKTGRITGYRLVHLDETGSNWRSSPQNVWKAERYLIYIKHIPLKTSNKRYHALRKRYLKHGPPHDLDHWW